LKKSYEEKNVIIKKWGFFFPSFFMFFIIGLPLFSFIYLPRSNPQPVSFSHNQHVEEVGIECQDCHQFREDGSFTGIPGIESCKDCHEEPLIDSPAERKLLNFIQNDREISWIRTIRQPNHVYFSHTQMVKKGGKKCMDCHKTVKEDLKAQFISMKDCMDCHKKSSVTNDCLACHK